MSGQGNVPPDVRLGRWQAVWLVAGREVTTRLRSKAFIAATVVTLLLLIGFAVVMKLVSGGSDATVGFTEQNAVLQAPLQSSAKAVAESVDTATVPDEATGRGQVADGTLDALLVGDATRIRVVVKKDLDDKLRNVLNVLAGRLALNQEISRLGGDPAQVSAAVAAGVESIEPPYPYQPQQLALGMIQMAVIGVVGVVAALAIGVLTISVSAAAGTLVWLVVWFLLGFAAYSLVFAALAVLLVLAMIPALVWLTGRIYRNAVVRSGAKVKLTEALRPA